MGGRKMLVGWISALLVSAGMVAAELSTVAYVVDRAGFEAISYDWLRGEPEDWDPFGDAPEPAMPRFTKPIPLAEKPSGTRFFRDGDRMWLMTGHLRELRVLESERSWAVWNEETSRMVVHGTRQEHGFAAMLWDDLHHPWRMEAAVELVKVRCRELEAVDWNAEEVRKRNGTMLGSVATTTRPGAKGSVGLTTVAGDIRLETEGNVGRRGFAVSLNLAYTAAVRHADGGRQLNLSTGVIVYGGENVFLEVGGADGGEETYLVGISAVPQFMDGTPRRRWREHEDEEVGEAFFGSCRPGYQRMVLNDGMILMRYKVGPTYIDDLTGGPPGPDDDPFAVDDDPFAEGDGVKLRPVESPPEIGGYLKTDSLYDLRSVMKENGILLRKNEWVYFNETRHNVLAKLNPTNTDLMEALLEGTIYCGFPRMIHGTASVIEWSGDAEPGRIPSGAKRLARMGVVAQTGQRARMRHGWPADQLKRGVFFQMEPEVGANPSVLGLKLDLEVAGEVSAKLSTGLKMTDGQWVLVPLGEEDGKKLGAVITARVIDGTGAWVRPRE